MNKRITKAELVAEIAENANVKKAHVSRVLKELAEVAYREAANGFIVPGICKLSVIRRKARRCRIPSTGQLVMIGERDALKIVPIGAAKNRIAPRDQRNITVIDEDPSASKPASSSSSESELPEMKSDGAAPDSDETSDGSIVFSCSDCGAMISAPASSAGADGECPFCGVKLKIPDRDEADNTEVTPAAPQLGANEGGFILFTCGECGQEIECASSMGGLVASCPTCGSQVDIPMSSTVENSADNAESENGSSSSSMTMRIDLMDLE
jgi:nucleoid DNA-binding protein/DNA-directed RNA polymerase subunit RPC12/RpoP